MKFAKGDLVKVNNKTILPRYRGMRGNVTGVHRPSGVKVEFSSTNSATFFESSLDLVEDAPDKVNHPDHYKWLPVEAIEITEHFNFCMGNALKYIIRADHKNDALEDLKKSRFYIDREIARRERLHN